MSESAHRLLSIGEFSAATQLSAKALRLYDEGGVLRPVSVAASGYRFYDRAQIATGRLVRRLREMDIPLAQIAEIVAAPLVQADALLTRAAQQIDQRHARQKRAYQSGLALLHGARAADEQALHAGTRPALRVAVRALECTRSGLLELLHGATRDDASPPFCWLIDPLGEEPGRIELAVPIAAGVSAPPRTGLRELAAAPCVCQILPASALANLEGALDAMFDWLDRRGLRASEPPALALEPQGMLKLGWTHETAGPESPA